MELKNFLSSRIVSHKPTKDKPFLVYLEISNDVISSTIVQDHDGQQQPIYFISRVLHDADVRYQVVEK